MSSQTKSNYFICDSATGRVEVKVFGKPGDFPLAQGKAIVASADHAINDVYFDSSLNSLKPKQYFAEGEWVGGEFVIPLPIGTVLVWQGQQFVIDDGQAEITVDQPGEHIAKAYHPHYHSRVYTIEN